MKAKPMSEIKSRADRYPRLDTRGHEVLDPKPTVIYMRIDPNTGEVLQEGRPRPPTLEHTIHRSLVRNFMGDDSFYDADDENDFDEPENDGSIPLHSPHSEGFTESVGMSEAQAIKTLKKAGKLPPDFGNPKPAPAKPPKSSRPSKAGDDETPLDDAGEQ